MRASTAVVTGPVPPGAGVIVVDFVGDEPALSILVQALVYAGVPVIHFAEQSSDLEDIFMQVTRGVTQ